MTDPYGQLKQWKGIHSGPCVVMGNGPSLNDHGDMDSWALPPVIGTNSSWIVRDPEYHVLLDRAQWAREIPTDPQVFDIMARKGALFTVGGPGYSLTPWHDGAFSWDITQGVREGWPDTGGSVVLVALQLAAYMGFTKVFLLGCDLIGGKFYDEMFHEKHVGYGDILQGQVELFRRVKPELEGRLEVLCCGARVGSPNPFQHVPFEACLT